MRWSGFHVFLGAAFRYWDLIEWDMIISLIIQRSDHRGGLGILWQYDGKFALGVVYRDRSIPRFLFGALFVYIHAIFISICFFLFF